MERARSLGLMNFSGFVNEKVREFIEENDVKITKKETHE